MTDCIFCQIAHKKSHSHVIWEDEKFIAFLSIFPNTEGVTVVIPKTHYSSYIFDLPDEVLSELLIATKKVAKMLDLKLEDVGRTALVFEGFGVDHVHAKLFPMHGTANMEKWKPLKSNVDKYFSTYEGYISSHDYKKADDKYLSEIALKILS
ncbi:MAG: HIT family protein [Candidatus Gracilibacteria bacterium]